VPVESVPVSFVIPVFNGRATLEACLRSVLAQGSGRAIEIIAVDDGSTDGSTEILERYHREHGLRLLRGKGRGAASALNLALTAASHAYLCQVDQDVVLDSGWLDRMLAALETTPQTAGVQGYYHADRSAPWLARLSGLDLEERYARISSETLDHVCTGNSAYRTRALCAVGGFDESLGYGYDNDLSYRLTAAGYQLRFCREARSVHHWRSTPLGYWRQQYGVGYGRLDLVAKHPRKFRGDKVSSLRMMLHPPLTLLALAAFGVAGVTGLSVALWTGVWTASGLLLERAWAGLQATLRFKDPVALLFPAVHLFRNLAWLSAMAVWTARRLLGARGLPEHSMFAPARKVADSPLRTLDSRTERH